MNLTQQQIDELHQDSVEPMCCINGFNIRTYRQINRHKEIMKERQRYEFATNNDRGNSGRMDAQNSLPDYRD
jgi:hypothetical protein